MPVSERKREYNARYSAEHYTTIGLKMLPEDADMIRAAAAAAGQSNSQYVIQAVRERMEREEKKK